MQGSVWQLAMISFFRTLLIYLLVLFVIRLMGKREVGELSSFDLVVAIMIAELAVIPMEQVDIPLYVGLIPLFTLAVLEVIISFLCLKSRFVRRVISGSPSIIIANGKIMEDEMRRLRYNVNDLLGQLREKDVANIEDVDYAILETSGELSVILKPDRRPVTPKDLSLSPPYEGLPVPLIFDGEIHQGNLRFLGYDVAWLKEKLAQSGQLSPEDVLFASMDSSGNLYISEKQAKLRQQKKEQILGS